MESSAPYREQPLPVLHPDGSSNKDKLQENDFEQISSQTLLDFLPSIHNVPKGSLDVDLPDFNLTTNESLHGGDIHSSLEANAGCSLPLNPFSAGHQLGDGSLRERPDFLHVGNTSGQGRNILPDGSNYLETTAVAHQLQGPEISLSSHIFSKNLECSESILSGFSDSMLPFHTTHDNDACGKLFIAQEVVRKHIESDHHSLQVMGENVMLDKINENCSKDSISDSQTFIDTSLHNYSSGVSLKNISNEKLNSPSDLFEHIGLMQHTVQEMEMQDSHVTCSYCPKAFKTPELLAKHEALHPYQTSAIQCSKCGEILGNYMLLQEHKQYEDYLSSCDICGQLFPNEECMMCHIRNCHNDFEDIFDEECNAPQEPQVLPNVSTEEAPSNLSSESEEVLKDDDTMTATEPNLDSQTPSGFKSPETDIASVSVNACEDPSIDQSDPEEEDFNTPDEPVDSLCLEPAASESSLLETDVFPEEVPNTFDDQNDSSPASLVKPRKTKCQFCSKKCSTRKSLVRHERSHPYGTAAMKCNLCLEVVENYKAMKVHKKNRGTYVSCSTCNQVCPNETCLKCHVRNVHNNSVYEVQPMYDVYDSNEDNYEEEESDGGAQAAHQYSVARFTVSDSGAPLRITIKQEKEEVPSEQASPVSWASTPPTPATPSPQGPPTPSPPMYVYESEPEPSDGDDQEYEPYESDRSMGTESKKPLKRKTSLRSTRKSSTNSAVLLSSEESDHDESADFNYTPQSNSESEIDSDNEWEQYDNSWGGSKKRAFRKKHLSDDDSDEDPDWGQAAISPGNSKKRGRRKRGPLSDDSDNDVDWSSAHNSSGSIKKKSSRKRSSHSEDDSDYDPDWNQEESPPGIIKKKLPGKKRGRKKKLQVAFFLPAIPVPKVKRPRAGGQKAQDAAAALAQAVEDMETTVPELKTVIKPVRRSVTKASLKRYNEMADDEYDYLLNVKPEPKEGPDDHENITCSTQDSNSPGSQSNSERYQLNSESSLCEATPNTDGKTWDQREEQIVIKAEPYDFQDDDLSEGTDLYFSKKFCEPNSKYGNNSSPSNNVESETDEGPTIKKELRYGCKICGRALQYRSHLVRHLRRVHDGEGVEEVMRRLMKCRFCEKPYSNELSLINHEKLHDGTSKMKCNKCEERFDDKNALRRHQRKMHWEHQPVECELCKKQLSDNTCLKAHMKHMHGADEKKVTVFTCETCGRQLHTKTAFQNHVASKCGTNLLFPCETCGKSFSFKGSLKAHQLLHTGVKSFLCKFCGKAFHQKGEMKRHERKHTGEKPFVCEVCGRAFAYRESLLGHSAVHTGIKPFPCKTCGMRFSCSGNLVKHRRSNNCKGSSEQGDTEGAESAQENLTVSKVMSAGTPCNVIPETVTKLPLNDISITNEVHSLSSENSAMQETLSEAHNSMTNQALKNKQEPVQNLVTQSQHINQTIAVSSGPMHSSQSTSVIKSAPGIIAKPTSALQASTKDMKHPTHVDVPQSYSIPGGTSNRLTDHLNSVYDRHGNNVAAQSSYSSHNLASSYNDNHFRQTSQVQVSVNDRRYSQFSMDGYASRTDQYFDRQSLMRHEMNRQVMERAVERQTPRFLDCFGGVQFSGVDGRSAMQSYPAAAAAAALPHASGYPNIHSGHLGNYAGAHTVNHSSNHANMYGGNSMMPGPGSFPGFAANNHIGMGYAPNNPIPAHSVAHSSSYPASHMSHLEALFGHFSQNAANNSFQRLSSHNVGPPGNPSLPSNHRV